MRRRPLAAAALIIVGLLLAALLAVWFARFRIAAGIVDGKLRTAGVPASYRITKIGPFLERMEDVRLGDPRSPDLLARQIDVEIGYGLSGPIVRHISVDGVRLRGQYDARGFHLGALDRLLPTSGGKARLPDVRLSIRNAELTLGTPAGALSVAIGGEGNPARRFRGDARLAALSLSVGGCVAHDVAAVLKIASNAGKPDASGPVRVSGVACPAQKLTLGQGAAQIALASDAAFSRLTLDANLAGLGGRGPGLSWSSIDGAISGSRSASGFGAAAKLNLKSASAPALAASVRRPAQSMAGTPLGPIANRALPGLASLLALSDATIDLNVTGPAGRPLDVSVHHVRLTGARGATVDVAEGAGLSWTQAGLRADADVTIAGGALPTMRARLNQAAAGAPLTGILTVAPYRAGNARLSATPARFGWAGGKLDFDTVVALDGPFANGFVQGLTIPLRGFATRSGGLAIDRGCHVIAFRQLRVASFRFDPARLPICGEPIVARAPGGAIRFAARSAPLRLSGRTADGAPVTVGLAQIDLTQAGFKAGQISVSLGGGAQPTRLAIAALNGAIRNGHVGGRFAGAAGAIGNVPLNISESDGAWAVADGTLRLSGQLRVSDAQTMAARFNSLVTDDAKLTLTGGTIAASATLLEPATRTEVARVALAHDLSNGVGHAALDVPGIVFVPKGLQPEQLTPLTLGVIANVAGAISGQGRIDWTGKGVTSSGDFGTERIDLAAAFGPVTGLKGRIHFTDLLGLVSAPRQEATIAEINPGVSVTNGIVHYRLVGDNRLQVEDANWPFAGGTLSLDPTTLEFSAQAKRHLTFRIKGLDAAAFVQQLDFPNISATGTFDGLLPMIFDQSGGRIEGGKIVARGTGTLAYIGELSNAQLGTMGKLAFDALKAIRYSALDVSLDGRLDGEMVSVVRFTGVREATREQTMVTRLIRNLPFRFNIAIRAPFRGLVGSARAYIDPRLLLTLVPPPAKPTGAEPPIQPPATGAVQ